MKTVIIAVLMACAVTARATPFDIGPAGTSYTRSFDFEQLDGITMNGQTLAFDLNFNNSVHLFQKTGSGFMLFMVLQTNGTNNTGFIGGNGFVLDALGQEMCGMRPLGSAKTEDGRIAIGLFPLIADNTGQVAGDITRPLDFYGAHFSLLLPDTGLTITSGDLSLIAENYIVRGNQTQGFRVGPHVPDNGSTFLFFGVGIVALWLGRFDRTTKLAVEKGN